MIEHPKLTVSFEIDARGEELFFRALHKEHTTWHGPYDLHGIAETIGHYIFEDAQEAIGADTHWFTTSFSDGGEDG